MYSRGVQRTCVPSTTTTIRLGLAWHKAWHVAAATYPVGHRNVTISSGTIHEDMFQHVRTLVGVYVEIGMLGSVPGGLSSAAAAEALNHAELVRYCVRHCAWKSRVYEGLNGLLNRTFYSPSKGYTSSFEPLIAEALDAPGGAKDFQTDPHLVIFRLISRVFLRERKKLRHDRKNEAKKRRADRANGDGDQGRAASQREELVDRERDRIRQPSPTNRLEASGFFRVLGLLLVDHKRIVGLVAAGSFRSSLGAQLGLLLLRETSLYPEYWQLADDPALCSLEVKGVYDGSIPGGGRLITLGDWLRFFRALDEVAALPNPTPDQQRGVPIAAPERVLEFSTSQVRDLLAKAGWSHAWGNNGALDQEISRSREKVHERFGELFRGGQ